MEKFCNLRTTFRFRISVRLIILFLAATASSFWLTAPAGAIIVCHDYALYRATGVDPRPKTTTQTGTGYAELRLRLEKELGYVRYPITYSAAADPDEAQRHLKPGDVILLRNDHSGYVNESGTIDHFIQVYDRSGEKYDAWDLPRHPVSPGKVGGLYLGDSLRQFLERPFYKGALGSLEVWRRGDCQGTEVSYDADEGGSDLAGSYPTRGFTDSDQVDVWIPFNITFPAPEAIEKATVWMYLKPIGQLTGTDSLGLKGADGRPYWTPLPFKNLRPEFQYVSVEVTEPSVLAAIRTGRLEGVVQDDSAVTGIKLEMKLCGGGGRSAGGNKTSPAYDRGRGGSNKSQNSRSNGIGAIIGSEINRIANSGAAGSIIGAIVGKSVSVEYDTDRPGADYRNFDLPQPEFEACRKACADDPNCKAYTYVKPGVQGAAARCWLKSGVPAGGRSSCCISGIKP